MNFSDLKMDPIDGEVAHDLSPFFRVYKDGRVQRLTSSPILPPSDDPTLAVRSKDVVLSTQPNISARLYLPTTATATTTAKLPLLIYFHGGAFSIESAFSTLYHTHVNSMAAAAGVVAVSVEYRLAPEHPIPACYEDCWEAIKWVGQAPDPWMQQHADLSRVFLAGDSAGANIAHNMAVRLGAEGGVGSGVKVVGMALVHPYFEFGQPGKRWMYMCSGPSGADDPRINPAADPLLGKLGCEKVLVCVAGEDGLRATGWRYYETLKKSGWGGDVEITETNGEGHVFHLLKPHCEKAGKLVNLVASFLN